VELVRLSSDSRTSRVLIRNEVSRLKREEKLMIRIALYELCQLPVNKFEGWYHYFVGLCSVPKQLIIIWTINKPLKNNIEFCTYRFLLARVLGSTEILF
jgi:hypothetical protein